LVELENEKVQKLCFAMKLNCTKGKPEKPLINYELVKIMFHNKYNSTILYFKKKMPLSEVENKFE